MKVILNPGHSPTAPGRRGPTGVTEHDVVQAVTRHVANGLATRMIQVELRQEPAGDPEEATRALAARFADETVEVDLALSLHCNWSADPAAYGFRCHHLEDSQDSRLLAECLARQFPRTPWAGVATGTSPLLAQASYPMVQVKLDFLSNPEVEALMRIESWQRKVADNLVEGIFAFIGPQDIRIHVNGTEIHVEPAPQVVYNDVLVPVRVLGAALGARVRWDPRRRVVTIRTASPDADSD